MESVTMEEGAAGRFSFLNRCSRPGEGYNCIPDDSRKLIGRWWIVNSTNEGCSLDEGEDSFRQKATTSDEEDKEWRATYMRVNEVIRGRSFGERLSIVEMPREGQLLCWSLHINSAVDLSSLKLHCFQISLKVTVRISSEELVTPPVLKAFITQSFHGKLFPWPRIDDHENLGIFFKPSKRFDFETIVDPILEPSGKKTRQIFQDSK